MAMIDRNFTFATNGTVTANDLHNLIDSATIYQDLITGQLPITSVGTNYELLIADGTNPNAAPNAVTVYDLFDDALTAGTYTNANISAALTYGTATGTRLVSANATITTGTITTGVIPNLTAGTTTSTAATITSGTVTNLASTTGTIATLNSTTGTITNLSTNLAGDFTISNGTGTLGTSGVTLGTYGSVSAIPFITVDAKGRITSATTGTFSSTPADGSITFAKLSTSGTEADNVASRVAKAWVNFNGTGTVSITASFNVSSITDNSTGNFTANFTAAMADAKYATVITTEDAILGGYVGTASYLAGSVRFRTIVANTSTPADAQLNSVVVFR